MKKIAVTIFLAIITFGCTQNNNRQDWYLKGSNVHLALDWPEKHIMMEEPDGMIFSGVILSQSNKSEAIQIHVRIDSVGELYKDKYPEEIRSDFVIWLEYTSRKDLKVIINQISTKPYFFVDTKLSNQFIPYKQGRYLSEGEIKTFFKDNNSNYYNIISRFAVNILSNKEPALNEADVLRNENNPYRRWLRDKYKISSTIVFKQMTDYLKDLDPSTAFITKEPTQNLQLEYILNDNKSSDIPTPLKQPVPIKGIWINTGNLDNKQDFQKYRRAKTLTIYFSNEYSGGLGSTRASYNEECIRINLTDEPKTHFILLYQPILAKVISVRVDSYYLGDKDEMAFFDLVFFGNNL